MLIPQETVVVPAVVEPDDRDVIRRSWRDGETFAVIFDRHAGAVHRYVSRRVGASLADDLTAETFLVAFRGRKKYNVEFPDARPWLYGIATNLVRRERRAEVYQYRTLARTGVDPLGGPSEEDAVVARVVAGAQQRRLAAALADLSAGERNILLLVAWEQLGYEEVARALSIPVSTVRSRLHSARKRVRAALADLRPDQPEES